MLECYADDSGTHIGSRAVVWGCLAGHKSYFKQLNDAWELALKAPCKGRPAIESFHSCDLAASKGQFSGYSLAERDRTRYNFRKAIIDSTLTPFAIAVSVEDWDSVIKGPAREFFGDPERWICGEVLGTGFDLAKEYQSPITFRFDQERETTGVTKILDSIRDVPNEIGIQSCVKFSSVKDTFALQAADMVAHQTYQHFLKTLDNPGIEPDPHMYKLMEDSYDWGVKVLSRHALTEMVNYFQTVSAHPSPINLD